MIQGRASRGLKGRGWGKRFFLGQGRDRARKIHADRDEDPILWPCPALPHCHPYMQQLKVKTTYEGKKKNLVQTNFDQHELLIPFHSVVKEVCILILYILYYCKFFFLIEPQLSVNAQRLNYTLYSQCQSHVGAEGTMALQNFSKKKKKDILKYESSQLIKQFFKIRYASGSPKFPKNIQTFTDHQYFNK